MSFSDADRVAIEAVLREQCEGWNRGDLAAFMDGYARTDALVFTSCAQIRRGWQETFDRYAARYGGDSGGMGTLGFEILEVQSIGADGAVVTGRWKLTDTVNAGGGVFSVVFERRAKRWLIVHDHTSADPT